MIFMRVREDDAPNIGDANTSLSEAFVQGVIRFFGFRAGVDKGNRIFRDQVDVNWSDVERRGKGDGNDAHVSLQVSLGLLAIGRIYKVSFSGRESPGNDKPFEIKSDFDRFTRFYDYSRSLPHEILTF